ncbi:MAG: cupredoxin domain-containing protein [Bacteroidota bacterium]
MKKVSFLIAVLVAAVFTVGNVQAQDAKKAKTIKLDQVPGEFTKTSLKLKAGQPYIFQVTNKGVDKEVGFVIAQGDPSDQKNHVAEAYLSKTIKDGETASSKVVTLEPGTYQYFCPLNPTPHYEIVVK